MKYVADTSTVVRVLQDRDIDARWLKAVRAGLVGVCPPVEAELVRSSSGPAGRRRLDQSLQSLFAWHPVPDDAWRFVARTQEALVAIGHHKGPSVADLLVAATAEAHDLTVLHVDADFEAISRVSDVKSRRADRP